MRRYIDEYYEIPEKQWLSPNPDEIKQIVLGKHNAGISVEDIVRHLQKVMYIFTDEEETAWETEVVESIISGKAVINRFSNEEFK